MLCHGLAFVRSMQLAAMQCKVTTHICGRIPWSRAEVFWRLAGQSGTQFTEHTMSVLCRQHKAVMRMRVTLRFLSKPRLAPEKVSRSIACNRILSLHRSSQSHARIATQHGPSHCTCIQPDRLGFSVGMITYKSHVGVTRLVPWLALTVATHVQVDECLAAVRT